jgi:hypothetical protein
MAEAAKCWIAAGGRLPKSISSVVSSDELIAAHFEYPTLVWGGGTAMTDVMAFIPNGVIAVEAKVDEPLDDLVADWLFREERNNANSPPHRTRVIQRYASAFGIRSVQLLDIRYQLLQRTLCAALTARARGVSQAWMVVQSFTSKKEEAGHIINQSDFNRFTELVGSAPKIKGVDVRLSWVSDNPTATSIRSLDRTSQLASTGAAAHDDFENKMGSHRASRLRDGTKSEKVGCIHCGSPFLPYMSPGGKYGICETCIDDR